LDYCSQPVTLSRRNLLVHKISFDFVLDKQRLPSLNASQLYDYEASRTDDIQKKCRKLFNDTSTKLYTVIQVQLPRKTYKI